MFFFLFIIACLFVLFIFYTFRKKQNLQHGPKVEFVHKEQVLSEDFNPEKQDLTLTGEVLLNSNISDIFLVHGTFVGDDPFDIVSLLTQVLPKKYHFIETKLKSYLKKSQDFFAKDLGNFSKEHSHLILSMCTGRIKPHLVYWSSGNHHLARFKGALSLIEKLTHADGKNILLIGHSHAGQIFALLSRFLSDPSEFKYLLQRLEYEAEQIEFYLKALKEIKDYKLDIVTLGSPARYKWYQYSKIRLLHIINHRGQDYRGGDFAGAVFTRSGDYVQQWGIEGSDIRAASKVEQDKNIILSEFLGESSHLQKLKEGLRAKNRLHNLGDHLLVDFGDDALYPNFFRTILGHGCYTKIKHFKLILNLVIQKLYSN